MASDDLTSRSDPTRLSSSWKEPHRTALPHRSAGHETDSVSATAILQIAGAFRIASDRAEVSTCEASHRGARRRRSGKSSARAGTRGVTFAKDNRCSTDNESLRRPSADRPSGGDRVSMAPEAATRPCSSSRRRGCRLAVDPKLDRNREALRRTLANEGRSDEKRFRRTRLFHSRRSGPLLGQVLTLRSGSGLRSRLFLIARNAGASERRQSSASETRCRAASSRRDRQSAADRNIEICLRSCGLW